MDITGAATSPGMPGLPRSDWHRASVSNIEKTGLPKLKLGTVPRHRDERVRAGRGLHDLAARATANMTGIISRGGSIVPANSALQHQENFLYIR